MRTLSRLHKGLFLIGATFAAASPLQAQHYPAGSAGIKGATLPGPGLFVSDDNTFYFYHQVSGFFGQEQTGFEQYSYTQTPRLTWVTSLPLLDADYGAALRIPFVYQQFSHSATVNPSPGMFPGMPLPAKGGTDRHFGLSDIEMEPVILAWHLPQFDFVTSYSVWAPTGDWNRNNYVFYNLGQGYWTHTFTLGATWYIDAGRTWAVSILNHYEVNTAQYSTLIYVVPSPANPQGITSATDTTLGDIYTLEWAVSKTVVKGVDVGVTGYYQQQVTDTQGPTFNGPTWQSELMHVAGIGPEIRAEYPQWGLSGSLRYACEFSAMDHPQGNQITFSLTKTF